MTSASQKSTAIVTIVSNNYLHFARTMLQSARCHHPDAHLYCVIVDRDCSHAAALNAEFEAIAIDKLGLPLGEEFLFQYNILELNTAVKPWAIDYLLARGHDRVCYVDPDICFYKEMSEVRQLLSAGTDIVLTPHLLAPATDDKLPRELDIRRAGAYNFGFCALRDTANVRRFLHWWQSKLTRDCVNDADRGLFVDQGWIDLVPGLFDNVAILRHKGYNVAYWNIAQRPLARRDSQAYFIDQEPLVFFHFSGLDPSDPASFSKHQTRFTLATVGPAKELVGEYVHAVIANGYRTYAKLEYGFARFSSGEKIPNIFRNLYRLSSGLRERMGPHPFTRASVMCDLWPEISIEGVSPTNAMVALWNVRHDVQSEFPLNSASSILGYYRWFVGFPPGAQHFSTDVISHHTVSIKRFEERAKAEAENAVAGQATIWPGNEQRVHHLYMQLLNRNPDPGGLQIYSELCKTDAGFVRAWGEIGLSPESKKRRFLWFRMLKALLISVVKVERLAIDVTDRAESTQTPVLERTFTGVFPVEADVLTEGVWVTDRIVISITADAGQRIRLEGTYFPESIERQTGNGESHIRFLFSNDEIHAGILSTYGDFAIECLIPASCAAGLTNLAIESSKVFVPNSIGPGDDERRLAWRMKTLMVGSENVFDCTNEDTYPAAEGDASRLAEMPASVETRPVKLAYTGFFQADADCEQLGVWASANVVVPVVPVEGEKIHLHGVYFPESIAKQTGSGDSTLRFFMGGMEVHGTKLGKAGDFTINFVLPKLNRGHGNALHIQCSKTFVPKAIGEGDDDRILSWRMKRLICGDITVLDCARQNIATSNRRFVPRMTHSPDFSGSQVKLFALYVPQFSTFSKDSIWQRARIASWADVSNAMPQYADHHQPQLPVELGFYDYRSAGVLRRQVALARQYGIAGFCFHYYWSAGESIAEQPLNRFLSEPSLDIAFCIYWDNEEMARHPDGANRARQHAAEDDNAFVDSLATAFADARCQKIDRKPVLLVANVAALPDAAGTTARWREQASRTGLPGLYLIAVASAGTRALPVAGFDAQVEFVPGELNQSAHEITSDIKFVNPTFTGHIYNYGVFADGQDRTSTLGTTRFEAVMPSWDNEVLVPGAGTSFADATPERYANWLANAVNATAHKRPEEQLLFINAWNAWGEGAHLEPDQRHGYGYLHATASALLNLPSAENDQFIKTINHSFAKRHDAVVILHIFYEDLIEPIFDAYISSVQNQCDLIVTVTTTVSVASLRKIKDKFDNCLIIQTSNCGRDIRPFILALRKANELGYLFGCKVHTKKSLHLLAGEEWRTRLFSSLLPDAAHIEMIVQRFKSVPTLGLIAPESSLYDLAEPSLHRDNTHWLSKFLTKLGLEKMIGRYQFRFPAGSMFWFRVGALQQLMTDDFVSLDEFEIEAGQLDGTAAHAVERIIGLLPAHNGFEVDILTYEKKSP